MNLKDIKALAAAGKIRGYKITEGPKREDIPGLKGKSRQREPGHKKGLEMALEELCREKGLPLFHEQMFHVKRKWRIDWLIPRPGGAIGIEFEGLGFGKTGHTESDRYTDNTTKYNAAAGAGIIVLRYTYLNWKDCIIDLKMNYL